jgi:hypothetical protein
MIIATKKDDFEDTQHGDARRLRKKQGLPADSDACDHFAAQKLQERLWDIETEMTNFACGHTIDAVHAVAQSKSKLDHQLHLRSPGFQDCPD